MKTDNRCPLNQHWHISYGQKGSLKDSYRTVLGDDLESALNRFLKTLPETWRGGISVYDDSILDFDEMPLAHVYL